MVFLQRYAGWGLVVDAGEQAVEKLEFLRQIWYLTGDKNQLIIDN